MSLGVVPVASLSWIGHIYTVVLTLALLRHKSSKIRGA